MEVLILVTNEQNCWKTESGKHFGLTPLWGSVYGSMLWRLDSPAVSSFFSAHTSCIKRVYRLPLNTFTYLVEGHLGASTRPLRVQVLSRLPKFYRKLVESPSLEVRLMAGLATKDARSALASNLAYVSELSCLDCKVESAAAVRCSLPIKTVPECENWRVGLLDTLLRTRSDLERQQSETKRVIALISSLCTTWIVSPNVLSWICKATSVKVSC